MSENIKQPPSKDVLLLGWILMQRDMKLSEFAALSGEIAAGITVPYGLYASELLQALNEAGAYD